MERLTYRDKDGFPMMKKRGGFKQGGVERLAAYEDTGLTPEEIDMDHEAAETLRQLCRGCDLDRLEKLAEADKDGRLVVLPCEVGTATYYIHYPIAVYPDKSEPEIKRGIFTLCDLDRVGHSVFLTHEEAEKALEAMKK
jgi:hypothetical protein|nr:MAG TPA: hypothetical protein [Caudoviricetes sp.]